MKDIREVPNNQLDCSVCGNGVSYQVLYPERLGVVKIDFSSRKEPQKVHYRIVRCRKCGLVYSNPVFFEERIANVYRGGTYFHELQVENYLRDYVTEFKKIIPYLKNKENLLEIGCANGFFLKVAQEEGFKNVVGVEPCREAVEKACPKIKNRIICNNFTAELFQKDFFDIVCFFQVLDHVLYPNTFLQDIYKILKPGGLILAINHNVQFLMTRLAGENSPMFDVGHIYLFDKITIRKIMKKNNFEVLYIQGLLNHYTLEYSLRMMPLIPLFKKVIIKTARLLKISNLLLKFPAGNMVAVARKIN